MSKKSISDSWSQTEMFLLFNQNIWNINPPILLSGPEISVYTSWNIWTVHQSYSVDEKRTHQLMELYWCKWWSEREKNEVYCKRTKDLECEAHHLGILDSTWRGPCRSGRGTLARRWGASASWCGPVAAWCGPRSHPRQFQHHHRTVSREDGG